jgi:hypothetical protein
MSVEESDVRALLNLCVKGMMSFEESDVRALDSAAVLRSDECGGE